MQQEQDGDQDGDDRDVLVDRLAAQRVPVLAKAFRRLGRFPVSAERAKERQKETNVN